MAAAADGKDSRDATRDEAADATDASRFFSRIGYLVLAVGAPVGVVLHPLGLYVMFSIGVALILTAAALNAEPGFLERFMRPFFVPAFLALLAGTKKGRTNRWRNPDSALRPAAVRISATPIENIT